VNPTQIEKLLALLAQGQVEAVLIGGWAAIVHGSAYPTFDVDMCYRRTEENIERLSATLALMHPYLRDAPPGLPFRFDVRTIKSGLNFTLTTDLGDLDLLGEVMGLGQYDQVAHVSEKMELFGLTVQVLSLDALIRAKRAAGRPKDLNALPELEALRALRNRQSKI